MSDIDKKIAQLELQYRFFNIIINLWTILDLSRTAGSVSVGNP